MGTSTWTLAARNVVDDPRVCLLFEAEPGPAPTLLRITGRAEVRTDQRTIRTFAWRCGLRYVIPPGAVRDAFVDRRLNRLRTAYYAQSAERGAACVITVTPDAVEVLGDVAVDPPARRRRRVLVGVVAAVLVVGVAIAAHALTWSGTRPARAPSGRRRGAAG